MMSSPPTSLLGIPIKVSAVPLNCIQFSEEPETPSELLIENLPSYIPKDLIRQQLEFMFETSRGFEVTKCRFKENCAYIAFSDQNGKCD